MYVIIMLIRLDALNSEAEFPGSNDAIEETKADLHEETEGINLITKSFNSSRGKIKTII